ncbi:MAG: MATE family multidrug resistance protein [Parasphingorhabdus sp.]|jgi:MATE family multidrug resistance protein
MSTKNNSTSHRQVWRLAGPIILANSSVPLVGAIDTAVVGHLPEAHHMGAVALGALIFSFLYWGFGFLRMGTTGFVAQYYGSGDVKSYQLILLRGLILASVIGCLVIMLHPLVLNLSLHVLQSSLRVEELTASYFEIRVWSAPATLLVYVLSGVLIGQQRTGGVLVLALILNVTNIGLDLLFVPWLKWGVAGVAWATLIAEYAAAIVGIVMFRQEIKSALKHIKEACQWSGMSVLLKTNFNLFIRTLCLIFSFSWFTAESAKMGELTLAANTVLMHLMTTLAYLLDGFAHAVEALAGHAFGRRSRVELLQAIKITTIWSVLGAVVGTVIFLLFGNQIISLFSNISAVQLLAGEYLGWVVLAPLLSVWSYQLDGIFIGTSRSAEMRNAMLISTFVYFAVAILLTPVWQNHGLWASLMIFMVLRAVTLAVYMPRLMRQTTLPLKDY